MFRAALLLILLVAPSPAVVVRGAPVQYGAERLDLTDGAPQRERGQGLEASDTLKHAEVTELRISGLRRTRDSTVRRILDLELPVSREELSLERLRRRLRRSGLFVEDMDLTLIPNDEDELTLHLELEDRWTLLALPIAAYNEGGWSGGLAVLESNLLGTGTQLFSFGMLRGDGASLEGWNTAVGVSGGVLQRGRLEPGVFLSAGQGEEERVMPDGEAYRRYREMRLRATLNATYRLGDEWSVGGAGSVSSALIDEDWEDGVRAPDSTQYYVQDASVSVDARRFVSFFQAGATARLRYRHGFPLGQGDHFDSVSGRAGYSVAIAERHKLEATATGRFGNEPITEMRGPDGPGYRTLPSRGTAAARAAAGALEFEPAVLSAGWGTITLPVFVETGVYNPDEVLTGFYGPGGGVRVYLARVAVPALGFNIAYNLEASELVAGVALGMSF